ncbi:sensor histidine kinase [Flavobacterium agrisoli]|uniref:histidine kinase n=1 Tax=Flavobacterium agrisoli TaxID=2793066 RepID=A0A934PK51_9FLAO|nr:CHASE3 domain-containing protein [Flavobacterium agrisoli]MBK0369082.1 CHASE3 domain-containing protein [Flavobacterium agrisoli]
MRRIFNFNSSNLLRVIFVIAVFILLFISSISYKHNRDTHESSQLLLHTFEINIELERLISSIKDAEIGQNGYIITHNERYLTPYEFSRDKVNRSFVELNKLTAERKGQQKNLKQLFLLINKRYQCLEEALKYSNSDSYNKEKLENALQRGRVLMANIRAQVDNMKEREKQFLQERQANYDNEISLTPLFTVSVFLVALILIILSYRQISKDIERLKITNKKLLISTKLMDEAEMIGNFSTWQWDLQQDKIHYSDNQFRLLGFSPDAFVPERGTFLNFVHPDDKETLVNSMQTIKEQKKLPLIYYRIVRQDGSIRHFKSIGKLLVENEENAHIILGISFDVTDEYEQNIELSQRNKELEISNQELASFNHVASHDLQEPLRKIQTFISRFSEDDKKAISVRGREYFEKIDASSKRMRVLIDDLLLFSRTNTTKKEVVKANLNDLFQNAKTELNEVITEKKAEINSEKLPKLNVIPYQIEQLFINLIGNSLKYSLDNLAPIIHIGCVKVLSKNYPDVLNQNVKKYYKITFQDNGMGFDPQFKHSIFVLFKRLHSKNDYPGTGIGLAICKKIVDNHNGFITADSNPGEGAVFTVFLPE